MRFEYLLFNMIVGIPPLLAMRFLPDDKRIHIRAYFWTWLVAVLFIAWDIIVAGSWWRFNPQYILGWNFLGLPIEEALFFVTVPWACLLIWQQLRRHEQFWISKGWNYGVVGLCLLLGVLSMLFSRYYTGMVLLISSIIVFIDLRSFELLRRKSGVYFFLIVGLLMVVFNGYLTGRPVVVYTEAVKLPVTVGTIPLEDFFYGWSLLGATVLVYEYFLKRELK